MTTSTYSLDSQKEIKRICWSWVGQKPTEYRVIFHWILYIRCSLFHYYTKNSFHHWSLAYEYVSGQKHFTSIIHNVPDEKKGNTDRHSLWFITVTYQCPPEHEISPIRFGGDAWRATGKICTHSSSPPLASRKFDRNKEVRLKKKS